MYKIYIDKKN